MTRILENPKALEPFGLGATDVANYLVAEIDAQMPLADYPAYNSNKGQHVFVNQVPLIGWLFKIPEVAQWGAGNTVNAQKPYWGPSVRMLWNMTDPKESTWVLPVGQSGHVGSRFYSNLQKNWVEDDRLKVFPNPRKFGL